MKYIIVLFGSQCNHYNDDIASIDDAVCESFVLETELTKDEIKKHLEDFLEHVYEDKGDKETLVWEAVDKCPHALSKYLEQLALSSEYIAYKIEDYKEERIWAKKYI